MNRLLAYGIMASLLASFSASANDTPNRGKLIFSGVAASGSRIASEDVSGQHCELYLEESEIGAEYKIVEITGDMFSESKPSIRLDTTPIVSVAIDRFLNSNDGNIRADGGTIFTINPYGVTWPSATSLSANGSKYLLVDITQIQIFDPSAVAELEKTGIPTQEMIGLPGQIDLRATLAIIKDSITSTVTG